MYQIIQKLESAILSQESKITVTGSYGRASLRIDAAGAASLAIAIAVGLGIVLCADTM